MLQRILNTISRFQMIPPGRRIVVACSGGADSTALLLILQELSSALGCILSVGHFNHRLRGEESDQDEKFVRELAERLGLALHVQRADVRACARSERANLEAKAREMRYRFLLSIVESRQADGVALGHTADDQAETVVHRFLRGAGTRGLAGIYPVVDDRIIRPLIGVRHDELLGWLRDRRQSWREDSSNRDVGFTRNRIRHELLPQLNAYNPRIVERMNDVAELSRDEESFWEQYLPPVISAMVTIEQGSVVLDIAALREIHPAVARRVLRWATRTAARRNSGSPAAPFGAANPMEESGIQEIGTVSGEELCKAGLGQSGSLDFRQIERLLELAYEGRSGSRLALPGRLMAVKEFSRLRIHKTAVVRDAGAGGTEFQGFVRYVKVPAAVEVPEIGRSFSFEIVSNREANARYNGDGEGLVDSQLAGQLLTLRNWQAGDAYQPKGRLTQRKIKEYFQRKRISIADRRTWPVLLTGDHIVWARGLDVAEEFSPPSQSAEAILIQERRL